MRNKRTAAYLRSLADKIEALPDGHQDAVLFTTQIKIPIVVDTVVMANFDVDDTLVIWNYPPEMEHLAIEFVGPDGHTKKGIPHKDHIKEIQIHKMRGHYVTAWSGGGWAFAYNIMAQLGLLKDGMIDSISTKPHYYWDDMDAAMFMGKPIYRPLIGEDGKEVDYPYTPKHVMRAVKRYSEGESDE